MTHAVAETVKIEADSDFAHRCRILDGSVILQVKELPWHMTAVGADR